MTSLHGTRVLVLVSCCALCGCGDGRSAAPAPFELKEVVAARIAAREADLGPIPPVPESQDWLAEEVEGMLTMLASSQGRMREVPLAAVREDLGPAAIPTLARALTATVRSADERVAAAELLATLSHPAATEALLQAVEQSLEPWMRRWCAYHLPSTGDDRVVPRLIQRLKYEQDQETRLWLAVALARFRNYAGLPALMDVRDRGATEALRATAAAQLEVLAADVELTAAETWRAWNSIDAGSLPQAQVSPALRLELWRLVRELDEDHFQLRGVDDARHVLSRLGPWAADEISAALADADAHVRLHCAQVLERMGPRANSAGPALLRALAEPLLAPAAAEALGRVGHPPALEALALCTTAGHDHELRVAALRALGRLGLAGAVPAVRLCFAETASPPDLRMAAATALVLLEQGAGVAPWLATQLASEDGDPDAAEIALETWLVRSAERELPAFQSVLEEWQALTGPPGLIPTMEDVARRQESRASLMKARLGEL
ncbi:MAG: HEAT repeat domain-containing protein [Planctomycetota bacterium]